MLKRITKIVFIITICSHVFNLLFFWLNSIIDSYFYWALNRYFVTGIYPFIAYFTYSRPTTISPPLYAILLAVLEKLLYPEIFLRTLQVSMLAATSYIIYRMLSGSINRHLALLIACIFAMFPTNVIYTNYMLTEIMAQFFIAVYVYQIWCFVKTGSIRFLSWSVATAAVMTLVKYSNIVFFAFSLLTLLYMTVRHSVRRQRVPIFPVLTGLIVIISWVFVNYRITGTIGISDTKGVQLYNQFVWYGRTLPSENNPAMKALRTYINPHVDLYRGYWDLQSYILPYVHYEWSKVDSILGSVASAAVLEHPISYIIHTSRIFISLHGSDVPYWDTVGMFTHPDPDHPNYCGPFGALTTCRSVITTPFSDALWDAYVTVSNTIHRFLFFPFATFIFLPLLFYAVIFGRSRQRLFGFLYLLGVVPVAAYVHPDTRYLVPFYPLIVLTSMLAVSSLVWKFTAYKQTLAGKRPKDRRQA